MTTKQEKILQAALELFAEKGVDGTSTSKIALRAGVSEGLIFRHFTNKEGLLEAILDQGKTRALAAYEDILSLEDPKALIRSVLELPFSVSKEEYPFWKLLYAVKWQANRYDSSFTQPIEQALTKAFKSLGWENPKAESETVMMLVDGIVTSFLLKGPRNKKAVLQSILDKYKL